MPKYKRISAKSQFVTIFYFKKVKIKGVFVMFKKLLTLSLLPAALFAGEADESTKSHLDLSLTTIAAIYTDVDYEAGDDHFAGLNGPFSGAKAVTRFNATYTLPTPLGEHWLLKGANVKFNGIFELSPLTIRPLVGLDFTPVPFLVFSAGGSIGTGWNPLGFDGMSVYSLKKQEYKSLTPFGNYYYDYWAKATFQFDTGALIEGDWSHVVMQASYKWIYEGITGVDDGDLWSWQVFPGEANGWQYDVTAVLGYQMPIALQMVGFMAEFYGHYDPADYKKVYQGFDGDFMWIDLSLLLNFKFNAKNELMTLITFEGGRSFATDHENADEEPLLKKTGREWSFYRIAFSWDHKF